MRKEPFAMSATPRPDDANTHAPGSQPAHFDRGRSGGGDTIEAGRQPHEVGPGKGDEYMPDRTPDEVAPGQGDFDQPDRAPIESPPQPDAAPAETPPPPD